MAPPGPEKYVYVPVQPGQTPPTAFVAQQGGMVPVYGTHPGTLPPSHYGNIGACPIGQMARVDLADGGRPAASAPAPTHPAHPAVHYVQPGAMPVQTTQPRQSSPAPSAPFSVTINGELHSLDKVDLGMTLNEFIRSLPNLKGTKKSCGEGGCGACTVVLSYTDGGGTQHKVSVNSCLRPLAACNGMSITTVEGIGSKKTGYHDIQQRLADYNGTQCGYCSPGFVMNMYALLEKNPNPTEEEIERYFDGNLCRCTGYRSILDAMKSFAVDHNSSRGCCPSTKAAFPDIEEMCSHSNPPPSAVGKCGGTVKACKKGGVCCRSKGAVATTNLADDERIWCTPTSLKEVFDTLARHKDKRVTFIVGNTASGIYKDRQFDVYVELRCVAALYQVQQTRTGVSFGAAVSINDFIKRIEDMAANPGDFNLSRDQVALFPKYLEGLHRIANTQVRNAGSIGGNIRLAHDYPFPSDLFTVLMGAGASITVCGSDGMKLLATTVSCEALLAMDLTGRVLLSVELPFSQPQQHFQYFKTAIRHVNSHSLINAAFSCTLSASNVISGAVAVFGGLAAHICRMHELEKFLEGKPANAATLAQALALLQKITMPDPQFGRNEYRAWLVLAKFYKFFLSLVPNLSPSLQSATMPVKRPVSQGHQLYPLNEDEFPLNKPMPKLTAVQQTSGEALYTDDLVAPEGTLHAAFILAPQAPATIHAIDSSVAMAMPGVMRIILAADVPGNNQTLNGVPLFATTDALYPGQPLGLVVAKSQAMANAAAKAVHVVSSLLRPPVFDIQTAVATKYFFDAKPDRVDRNPPTTADWAECDDVIEGSVACGSQYHFHLETHTALVSVRDNGLIQVTSANQLPTYVQQCVAGNLLVPLSDVVVESPRLGGGYGGKLSNAAVTSAAVAVASYVMDAPVKAVVDLNSNMKIFGKRHAMLVKYRAGFKRTGGVPRMHCVDLDAYIDSGCVPGPDTLGTAYTYLVNCDNAYSVPHFASGCTLTHSETPSHTYTRGPGWTQAVFVMEHILEHAAVALGSPAADLKIANFYQKNETSVVGMRLEQFNLQTIWKQLLESSELKKRAKEVELYNRQNRWTRRGLAMCPVKFGVDFKGNHHSAAVHINPDGTVVVTHSGVEMGQGIHTKVAAGVAYKFNIPVELVKCRNANTDGAPNTGASGGSTTSALCTEAAMKACDTLMDRLNPVSIMSPDLNPSKDWPALVQKALQAGINLQAKGDVCHGAPPVGGPFTYNSYSAAVCQVHVDVLTGEMEVERVDMLYDCGVSLSTMIDIGQIEGAFVFGLGMYMTEAIQYTPAGEMVTDGTWEYKPLSALDIPWDLRLALLDNSRRNKYGVMSSKCVGEPPLALACTVLFAAKNAIASVRAEHGLEGYFPLDAPATVDAISSALALRPEHLDLSA
eukprot:CAMPEP_0177664620 /NCGR_PEP_ID=MMETSP0447-20121125/20598_1 /TAXON_ID=0 /ORGANISM="Stygamoeba regulata, Strain BSH-02190019" /LENGTH=1404 /DNA_ID=CAMNT_0019170619 /DNA_START=82 /DNA_END=4296 /DNA_ORIENTATION=-